MVKEYTLDEIRRLADTNPAELEKKYQASRTATANLVSRAKAGIAARQGAPPATRFHAWAQGYGERFIYTGSVKPIVHMMLVVGITGIGIEYWCHHRHHKAHAAEEKHH
uniref:ATP synthase subunit n=1 Tax=Globisporangium ultimum (strain ATCC 200006 / CBS 805.95 / DAOM BR144) TaxID=431595 RepID=K3XB00_GLOUD